MKDYEVIEHTADIGIRVKAATTAALFEKTALAMFDIIAAAGSTPLETPASHEIQIEQESDNLEELLVFWLNELLSLSSTKELIFFDFKVKLLKNNRLNALVLGRPAKDYQMNTEIKAATYHDLKIREESGIWQAEVIFDV